MSQTWHGHNTAWGRLLAVLSAALLLLTVPMADTSSAHGSTINPASRNYGCWKRWGGDFQNPAMATQDPMCWQAWRADPNAMWNWNGLYRENVAHNHQGVIPNGQLCSGGRTASGRYNAMDAVGAWTATRIPSSSNFTVQVHDAARHGATYYRVYVTKQGFNPLTEPLGWDDLELVRQTGAYAPGAGTPSTEPQLNGVTVSIDVSAPGRTGRHMVYTIWQAAHMDQSYYLCSDVIFG
ncbi:lytic polysaccharide monooxygenase auxiliary activity family 9 protein [Allostreptomyces psammosilenae]|uniref:Chitin-binding protein n=1 Tax=Allostreptomyces psammosilenae TaxID=1892865 RepID=A0A852ZWX9_9ACTN|nr:lytic polysaccharide monooxygenase [Allostreptomyces psammosilenae]NYI06505.1 chitin-binding protein [Allostreptomyces psammosilenae]